MFRTILVALDGTEHFNGPMRYARQLARESNGNVVVVHVREMQAGRAAGPAHLDEDERIDKIKDQVATLVASEVETRLLIGSTFRSPATVIANAAVDEYADVIITGRASHRPVIAAVLGSTAQDLLHMAPCPVLAVGAASGSMAA